MKRTSILLALISSTSLGQAAITSSKASVDFTYLYEMDVNPSSQDLDSNSTSDFFTGTVSGITSPQTYSGGVAASDLANGEQLFRTDYGGSITRAILATDTPYTLELSVEKTAGTQGSQGWFSLALQSPGATQSARFSFKDDVVTFRTTGGTFTEYLSGTDFTSGQQVVRIAYEGSNNYYIWVNETLLNADLSTPINGGNGSFNTGGSWFIGNFSGDTGGDWEVDFLRFDNTGAFEPGDPIVPDDLTWTAATDSNWDDLTNNWQLTDTTPTAFSDSDNVTFDDTAASGAVTIVGTPSPDSILVNNDVLPYTLGGSTIIGPATLTKDGPGSLALTADHAYSGGTTLTMGTITAGDGATAGEIGAGPVSLASGTTLTISRSDFLDYKATAKMRNVSGAGDIVIDGGGTLWNYTGGGVAFASPNTWSGFSGTLTVLGDSEFQTIRNGATAMGTGTIILGDATTSGTLSQIEGNWTWTNDISVVGPANLIANNSAGAGRSLKIQGTLTGDGSLSFDDSTGAMTNLNRGFIITSDLALTSPLGITLDTPVRIGGVPGDSDSLAADSFGSLGTTAVNNEGTLTFTRTDDHSVDAIISGGGNVRIGAPSTGGIGDTSTQIVTFTSSQSYTGSTTVESGRLVIPSGTTHAASTVFAADEGTISGEGTINGFLDIEGTLAPGSSVGTLTTLSSLTLFGDAIYEWEIGAWNPASADLVQADSIDIFVGGDGPVTIAVTPDSIADFAETSESFIIATSANPITGFTSGDIIVDDSAFAAATGSIGTWSVDLTGDSLGIELTYTPGDPNSYAGWISGFFPGETDELIIGIDADPDGDGVDNGVENFLGTDPSTFSAGLVPVSASGGSLTASHTRSNSLATDLSATYEWSSDLVNWNDSGETDPNGVSADITTVVTDDQDAPLNDTVEVTAAITAGSTQRVFLRVHVTELP
ncbi:beta strand repeat-containing protein [Haloferula rosea]|uniref:Uncharacterized protein n=1 Tax=Haloferula rosea TaxID=490093 RepID=A0A934RC27_9BACT|nr:hypothetical protein [Haloferula rosea]MBK1826554.1 hypothetical protein [Haloferula rosea]